MFLSFTFSCGYALVGRGRSLPDDIRTISVPIFVNGTAEPNVEIQLSNTLREEFLFDGRLKVADEEEGDLLVKGELKGYSLDPVSFDANDNVTEYWLTLTAHVEILDKKRGEPRLKQDFSAKWDFKVSGDIAVTDIARVEALKEVSRIMAQQIISLTIEGF